MSDYNMEVAYRWALSLDQPTEFIQQVDTDHDRLISIVTAIQDICITNEFNYDRNIFRENVGRPSLPTEEPYVLQQFYAYSQERRQRLFDCIVIAVRPSLPALSDSQIVSLGLMLWNACISTSKVLDNRREYSQSQLTELANILEERAEENIIYRRGQEIACLYMIQVGQGQFINFERFSLNSAPRRHQTTCHQNR